MSGLDYFRERLAEHVDENGDIVPPWVKYPTRFEGGQPDWHMGVEDEWAGFSHVFLEQMDAEDLVVREAYLRRHPPAPHAYALWVSSLLGKDYEPFCEEESEIVAELEARGLIAVDAAYSIWCTQNHEPTWPWKWGSSVREVARGHTRELTFWSRRFNDPGSPRPRLPWIVPWGWGSFRNVLWIEDQIVLPG